MTDTLTCARCGHRGDYHYHDDDLLDDDCHDETGRHVCEHFRCRYPWQPRDYSVRPACDCSNFVAITTELRS